MAPGKMSRRRGIPPGNPDQSRPLRTESRARYPMMWNSFISLLPQGGRPCQSARFDGAARVRPPHRIRIFRFAKGLNLRNPPGHRYDFPHFTFDNIHRPRRPPARAGRDGNAPEFSRTSPGSLRHGASAVPPRKPSISHDSRRRNMPRRSGCSSGCSADAPCTRKRRSRAVWGRRRGVRERPGGAPAVP